MGIKAFIDTILVEWLGLSPRMAKGIRVAWDIGEMAVVVYLLYASVFYMGNVHYCDEIVKVNFGWMFNQSAMSINGSALHVIPSAQEVWNHVPFFGNET
jgi:hypothetical protein